MSKWEGRYPCFHLGTYLLFAVDLVIPATDIGNNFIAGLKQRGRFSILSDNVSCPPSCPNGLHSCRAQISDLHYAIPVSATTAPVDSREIIGSRTRMIAAGKRCEYRNGGDAEIDLA